MSEAENATRRSLIRMTWQTLYAFPVFDTLFILSKYISVYVGRSKYGLQTRLDI